MKTEIVEMYYTMILSEKQDRKGIKQYLVQLIDGRKGWTQTVHHHILQNWLIYQHKNPYTSRFGFNKSDLEKIRTQIQQETEIAHKTSSQTIKQSIVVDDRIKHPLITGSDVGIWCSECVKWYSLKVIDRGNDIDLTKSNLSSYLAPGKYLAPYLPCATLHKVKPPSTKSSSKNSPVKMESETNKSKYEPEKKSVTTFTPPKTTPTTTSTTTMSSSDSLEFKILKILSQIVFVHQPKHREIEDQKTIVKKLKTIEIEFYKLFQELEKQTSLLTIQSQKEELQDLCQLVYSFYKVSRLSIPSSSISSSSSSSKTHKYDYGNPLWVDDVIINVVVKQVTKFGYVLPLTSNQIGQWYKSSNLTRKVNGTIKQLKEDGFDITYISKINHIVIPVQLGGHWYGYWIDIHPDMSMDVITFDSMIGKVEKEMEETILKGIKQILQQIFTFSPTAKNTFTNVKIKYPQTDAHNCGLYLLRWLLNIKKDTTDDYSIKHFNMKIDYDKIANIKLSILRDCLRDYKS